MRKAFGISILLLLFWLAWPAKIDSVAYHPPTDTGFVGTYAENEKLETAEVLSLSSGFGPEDVAVDSAGRIYGGLQDGRIIRMSPDGKAQEDFAIIEGGRPLGMHFDEGGNLIVADAWKGLLSFSPEGEVTVLSTEHGGRPYSFTNDLDIASDGKVFFSDASDRFSQPDYRLDLLEAKPHGRLMVYSPATGKVDMLLDELYFANGVALSENEDFVLVNETPRYRILRYWLKGDKAGTSDVFIDKLPGFPDGLSANRKGTFWLAIPSPRNPMLDNAHPKPWLKNLLSKLPKFLQPSAIKRGVIIGLNEDASVSHILQDTDGNHVHMVTSVQQVGDTLYMGSLEAPQIARISVP